MIARSVIVFNETARAYTKLSFFFRLILVVISAVATMSAIGLVQVHFMVTWIQVENVGSWPKLCFMFLLKIELNSGMVILFLYKF